MLSDNLHILIQLLIGITVFLYLGNVVTLFPMALVEQFLQSFRETARIRLRVSVLSVCMKNNVLFSVEKYALFRTGTIPIYWDGYFAGSAVSLRT